MGNCLTISWREQVTFRGDDDYVRLCTIHRSPGLVICLESLHPIDTISIFIPLIKWDRRARDVW